MSGQLHALAALPPGRNPVLLARRLDMPLELVWTFWRKEFLAFDGI